MQITGAELFVKALLAEQVDTLFAYPGGQVIDLFHALHGVDGIQMILPRHEQGLVHAADGYARSTGRIGVCLVTSGPGATNLVTGIATANYDSVPLVCFAGQVPTSLIGKDSFQEVDIVDITKSICKYAVRVQRREDLAAAIQKAFEIVRLGKPGVAVVELPKDIQQAFGNGDYKKSKTEPLSPAVLLTGQLEQSLEYLKKAKRPLFLSGGGVRIARADREMTLLAEKTGIPVVTTIMGKGGIPTNHPLYVGNLGIHGSYAANRAVSECDVLYAIGARFNDRIIGTPDTFAPNAAIIHLDICPSSISKNIVADLPIVADAKKALLVLLEKASASDLDAWREQISHWKQACPIHALQDVPSRLTPYTIISGINQVFAHAVITTDVGQNQLWTTQFLELTDQKQMLTSGGLGTMGYGLPAAIGAKLAHPDLDVIAVCGDGGIQMNIQELATAVVYELPVIICILNNGYLGNVRQWQELFFDRHYSGTCLRYRKSCPALCNTPSDQCPAYLPDFGKLAESYGAKAIRVRRPEEVRPALEQARHTQKVPTVIEFLIEPEENVYPIVPPGNSLNHMFLGSSEKIQYANSPVCDKISLSEFSKEV